MKKQPSSSRRAWSRRKFLTQIGMIGGATAMYETMVAMNLIRVPEQNWEGPPKLGENHGQGQSVLILGAGIGGLTTAYLLSKAGYRCKILEATHRAGGRNFTARRGDTIIEEKRENDKVVDRTIQEAAFDDGLYVNMGPGRLPYHHRRVLEYCRELGVKLEPYLMNTTGNLFQSDLTEDFKEPVRYGKIQNDTRGYIAELLAKAVQQNALDDELSGSDKDNLLCLLESFGSLQNKAQDETNPVCEGPFDLQYEGTTRDSCGNDVHGQETPNVFHNCTAPQKLKLQQLLDSRFWNASFYDPIEFEWQPTLFQPVGGMDQIVEGFKRKVGHLITYNAPVVKIRAHEDGVKVTYMRGSEEVTERADYCVSNIPCPILSRLDTNFKEDEPTTKGEVSFAKAVKDTTFDPSCKVGWQCNKRFWEDDYEIYGGISWTSDIIEQIWYPSNDYFSQKGTLTGAYIHDENAKKFQEFSLSKRLAVARAGGAKFHPEFKDDSIVPTRLGVSIAWKYIPYQEGAWPSWVGDQSDNGDYERILKPFRRFHIVGDQASTLPGWQEGAMMSAEHVVELISGLKLVEDFPEVIQAPNTKQVTQGIH